MSEMPRRRAAPIRSISAVLPAFDEAPNLSQVTARTIEALEDTVPDFEIIIVDDGSKDATGRLADGLATRDARVRVVHHARRRGYGAALRAGISEAGKQFIWCLDADGQYNPADLSRLAQFDDAYDLVAGYRARRADSILRRLLSRAYRLLIRISAGAKARDPNCGFKLYRASTLKGLPLSAMGRFVQVEILVRLRERGSSITEVSVQHTARHAGRQMGARLGTIVQMARESAAFRKRRRAEAKSVPDGEGAS
jgi:glycosyltransferase involved in cell wall biosynthesis